MFDHLLNQRKTLRGVIQIGAGAGAEVSTWCGLGIRNQVYFEPQLKQFESLVEVCKETKEAFGGNFFIVALNYALSDFHRENVPFYMTTILDCCSLLPLDPERVPEFHVPEPTGEVFGISTMTLDEVIPLHNINLADYNLLVVDAQGHECAVLRGSSEVLTHMDYVVVEVCYELAYIGQEPQSAIDLLLRKCGFEEIKHHSTDKFNDGDSLYQRRSA